jgi:pimeloyl-ACP methyl ester carboxylesterase
MTLIPLPCLTFVGEAEPEIRYARSGDIHVAYSVTGDGPLDLVLVEGYFTHLGIMWEQPGYRRWVHRLASFARVIRFDKRGMGLSDRVQLGTLEERMDDLRAVLDALGSERAALVGSSEGGPLSLLFAAACPDRTAALVLVGAEVRERVTADWPWGERTDRQFERELVDIGNRWGALGLSRDRYPSLARPDSDRIFQWSQRLLRESAGPGEAIAFKRMAFDIDVRAVCGSIHVPTLVVHRVGDRICHVGNGRFLAEQIAGASYCELPGDDHIPWMNPVGAEEILAEIQEFLTGSREAEVPDRVLVTVLFGDLVASTDLLSDIGDARYGQLVELFLDAVRNQLHRYRGREVDTAGDGFFASFDGPARAIRCAEAVVAAARHLGLKVRLGVHTGEVEIAGDKFAGIAVHVGARVAALAEGNEILVSSTVRDIVAGSGLRFIDRGSQTLKGVRGDWRLYAVEEAAHSAAG